MERNRGRKGKRGIKDKWGFRKGGKGRGVDMINGEEEEEGKQ